MVLKKNKYLIKFKNIFKKLKNYFQYFSKKRKQMMTDFLKNTSNKKLSKTPLVL